jgi:hypothetical protein
MDLMGIVPSRPWYRRPWLWVGLVAALVVAAGAFLLLA